jgi:predicted ATPase
MGTILKNWALMEGGDIEGLRRMEDAVKEARMRGQQLWISNPLAVIAEQYGKNNQPEKGLQILKEAFELSGKNDDLFYLAELYRIKGFLLQQSGKATGEEIEQNIMKAFEIAQKQSAKNYQLRAACDLAKLKMKQGKGNDGIKILSETLHWFPLDVQTEDVTQARKLLNKLENSRNILN